MWRKSLLVWLILVTPALVILLMTSHWGRAIWLANNSYWVLLLVALGGWLQDES